MQKKLAGRIDMDSSGGLARTLGNSLRSGETLELDFSSVEGVDSAALALVLELRRQAEAQGAALALTGPTDELLSLARLYGLESLFSFHGKDAAP
jgi:phospholipid transport system transporter-binding protein